MDAGTIKRQAPWVILCVVGCVLAWKIPSLMRPSVVEHRVPPAAANAAPVPNPPPGSVLVMVNMIGFDPDTIPAKAGEPIKLAFFRPNANNCATEVVFPDLGIRKELPPGATTVVDITPRKSGALGFACGMNMLKGKLLVR